MNKAKLPISILSILVVFTTVNAQDAGKRTLEQDFKKYKQEREFDFQKFKKQREEELKKMQQEYQEYYNTMMGLKNYYADKKDTANANAIGDIIAFEDKVSTTLGKPVEVTEQIIITNNVTTPENQQLYKENTTATPQTAQSKSELTKPANNETTFAPIPTDGDAIPVLTPLPKAKSKITSPFGIRMHPTLHRPIKHNGVDFGSGRNTEIYASANGRVILAEYNRSFGNYIIIEHKDGTSSLYAHLQKIITTKGSRISKGDLIGYTGSTGRSSGAHLHYEVRISGIPVDPAGYLKETK